MKKMKPTMLFKFDYCLNDNDKMIKDFLNEFDTTQDAVMFIERMIQSATYIHGVIKTVFCAADLYHDDEESDIEFNPLFDIKPFRDLECIDDTIDFFRENKVPSTHLVVLKKYLTGISNANRKIHMLSNIIDNDLMYIIPNKFSYPIVDVTDEIKNDIIDSKIKNGDTRMLSITSLFKETKRTKNTAGSYGGICNINDLSFINKMVCLQTPTERILIEDSRKKVIVRINRLSLNFIALASMKNNFKKKTIQLFEQLTSTSKIDLIKCLEL